MEKNQFSQIQITLDQLIKKASTPDQQIEEEEKKFPKEFDA